MTGDPNTSASSTPTTTTIVETKEETVTVSEPVVAETSAGGDNAKDILAMIRARQAD